MTRSLDASLDATQVRRIYDRLGRRYDLLRPAEETPKRAALALLAVRPGERVLEVGVGTGRVLVQLARAAAEGASPLVNGLDLSPTMINLANEQARAAGLAHAVELRVGDARALPYGDASFDAAFSSYVLDLLPAVEIARALGELRRVLRPGGRLALVALAPGTGLGAHLFTSAYSALYRVKPAWLAGCRPIELEPLVLDAGFVVRARQQWFRIHPSEVVLAERP